MSTTTTDRAHLALRNNNHGTVSLQVVGRTVPKNTQKDFSDCSVCAMCAVCGGKSGIII